MLGDPPPPDTASFHTAAARVANCFVVCPFSMSSWLVMRPLEPLCCDSFFAGDGLRFKVYLGLTAAHYCSLLLSSAVNCHLQFLVAAFCGRLAGVRGPPPHLRAGKLPASLSVSMCCVCSFFCLCSDIYCTLHVRSTCHSVQLHQLVCDAAAAEA
jgi:hypothetical protein